MKVGGGTDLQIRESFVSFFGFTTNSMRQKEKFPSSLGWFGRLLFLVCEPQLWRRTNAGITGSTSGGDDNDLSPLPKK